MASVSINTIREMCPGMSDRKAAETLAHKEGWMAVVRYKSSPSGGFTHFGFCVNAADADLYYDSPNCHEAELIYKRG